MIRRPPRGRGAISPFAAFGLAVVVAGAFALFMGLAYAGTPTFNAAAFPTIAGTMIAIAAFLVIGYRAPPND